MSITLYFTLKLIHVVLLPFCRKRALQILVHKTSAEIKHFPVKEKTWILKFTCSLQRQNEKRFVFCLPHKKYLNSLLFGSTIFDSTLGFPGEGPRFSQAVLSTNCLIFWLDITIGLILACFFATKWVSLCTDSSEKLHKNVLVMVHVSQPSFWRLWATTYNLQKEKTWIF